MGNGRVAVSSPGHVAGRAAAPLSLDVRRWAYVFALLCLIALLAFVYLTQASQVAREIEQMQSLEQEIQDVKRRNNALLLEIAQYEQMPRVKQLARQLGFGEPEDVEYLEVVVDEPAVPSKSEMTRASLSPVVDSTQPNVSWWQKAFNQFTGWTNGGAAHASERTR
jgi:hypothetical protein